MTNKFIKNITLILITITMFLMGIKEVSAEICEYEAPLTYITKDSIATELRLEYTDYTGVIFKTATTTDTVVQKFSLKCDTDEGLCNIGMQTENGVYGLSNPIYLYDWIVFYDRGCVDYFIYDNAYKGVVRKSSSSQYRESLENMYGPWIKSNSLYGLYTIKGNSKDEGSLENSFAQYIAGLDNLVFVNKNIANNYPNKKLLKFKKGLEEIGAASSLEKFPIDKSDVNKITHTEDYYEATKDKWYNYMQNDINNPKKADLRRKKYFSYWFDNVSRYIFEKDLKTFKKYFVYLYEDNPTNMPGYNFETQDESTIAIAKKNYENYIKTIDGMLDYEDAESHEDCYTKNFCSAVCPGDCSGIAYEECAKSEVYNNCENAYKKCKHTDTSSFDLCMERELGYDNYEFIKEKRKSKKEAIEKEKLNALKLISSSLLRVEAPSLSGISFEGYKVKCEDVVVLHNIYVVLKIMAPVLVILFGTLDYVKSILGADEKKILEARKKFPKRLILLILFIIVPIIISILLGIFNKDASLMSCVIRGA